MDSPGNKFGPFLIKGNAPSTFQFKFGMGFFAFGQEAAALSNGSCKLGRGSLGKNVTLVGDFHQLVVLGQLELTMNVNFWGLAGFVFEIDISTLAL